MSLGGPHLHWKISFGILTYVNSFSLSSEPESIQRGRSSFQIGGNLYLLKVNKVTLFKETGRDVFCYSFLYKIHTNSHNPLLFWSQWGRWWNGRHAIILKGDTVKTHSPHRGPYLFNHPNLPTTEIPQADSETESHVIFFAWARYNTQWLDKGLKASMCALQDQNYFQRVRISFYFNYSYLQLVKQRNGYYFRLE